MVIHSPQPTNGSPNSRWAPRTGSLYEDIPLFGTFDICVSTSSSSLRSIISCVLLLLLDCCSWLVIFSFTVQLTQPGLLVFRLLTEEPQKSYSRRPTVHEVFSLSHNRSTAGGIVDGYGIFLFFCFSGGKSRTFRSLFFIFWFPLLN